MNDNRDRGQSIKEPLELTGNRHNLFNINRTFRKYVKFKDVMNVRAQIENFFHQVRKEEQPYHRVRDLVENARRRRGVTGDSIPDEIYTVQMHHTLLAGVLLLRTELAMLSTILKIAQPTYGESVVDLSWLRGECENKVSSSEVAK